MDIVRTNKTRAVNKKALLAGFLLCLVIGGLLLINKSDASYLTARDALLIDTVQRGQLNISVRGTGVLAPKDIRWIATHVSGRVERIFKKAGAKVTKDEVLLELSNPQLTQQLIEAKWELQALAAQTQARKVSLESELLDQEIAVISQKLNHERALLTLEAQKKLLSQGIVAISKIDYEEVKINVSQFQQLWELEQSRLQKRRENLAAQLEAGEATLNRMRKRVERIQSQVDSLKVRATMDSIVQEMPMELGQQVGAGSNLAMLARSDRFIAELRIPEKQIKDVAVGQNVTLDTRISKIDGLVQRVDPAVTNGSVQVDIELLGPLPKEVRPELTVDGVIEIATLENTLFVKRPMYANSFSQSSVYLIDEQGTQASQHPLTFGHMSSQFIQIQSGLKEGDSIIVSDTSAWSEHQHIRIN